MTKSTPTLEEQFEGICDQLVAMIDAVPNDAGGIDTATDKALAKRHLQDGPSSLRNHLKKIARIGGPYIPKDGITDS